MLSTKHIGTAARLLMLVGILICGSAAFAYPVLQLDIAGGTYDTTTETIVSSGDAFTLYALLDPNKYNSLSDTYSISAAITPQFGPTEGNLGSFTFNGQTIDVTGDMVYGVPPLETTSTQLSDQSDLPKHGIFYTYFTEFAFQFTGTQTTLPYNTQTSTGSGPSAGDGMYWIAFNVDTSLLNPDYQIHFDLYNTAITSGSDIDVTQFAPFSHDAESGHKVPEPSSLVLLGFGLMGVALFGRKKH